MGRKRERPTAKTFVLDSSLTVAWFFEDEMTRCAQAVEDSLSTTAAVVPGLWPLEVANALLMGERRSPATEAKVTTFLRLLAALPIALDDETASRAWLQSLLWPDRTDSRSMTRLTWSSRSGMAFRWQRSTPDWLRPPPRPAFQPPSRRESCEENGAALSK